MEVKVVDKRDINGIVRIHVDAFKGFFLTELGNNFLKKYYLSVLCHPDGILLGCFEDGKIIGFCAATKLSRGFNTRLVKANFLKFSFEGIRLLFTRPSALIRLVKNFTKSDETNKDNGEYSELLSIGVSVTAQGGGVGKKLVTELETYLRNMGAEKLSLTTDFEDNEKAVGFYNRMGYNVMYDFIAYPDRHMYRMIKNL